MDAVILDALREALRLTPSNIVLRMTLVRALIACENDSAAHELLIPRPAPGELNPADARLVAQLLLKGGEAPSALPYLDDDSAESRLLRCRVQLALGARSAARDDYRAAIGSNSALQDRALESELEGKVVNIAFARSEQRVRSIANDDTAATELQRWLQPPEERIDFAAVGGLEQLKTQIRRRIITPFQKPSLFERFKRRIGGGILMYGPPGCGKTLLARATAGECGARFYNVAISDVLDMYIGESERKLHALFEDARRSAPAVVFFDEVEALGGKRQFSREGTSSKLVSQFLSELDGFAQNKQGVLVLAATNIPWAVDAAFRRPGRFDRVLFVPPPDRTARASILAQLLEGRPTAGKLDCEGLAAKTAGFSGADLKNLIETAVDAAIEESIDSGAEAPITQAHLLRSFGEVKATTLEWLTTARNYARYANEGGQYDDVLAFIDKHAGK
ncbi:MAG: AAA family ATPase [Panacagrimonas sp.]